MNTDEHGSGLICTANVKILRRLERIFLWVRLGAHASCVPGVIHAKHAGSWKRALPGQETQRSLRLCGEAFGLRLGRSVKFAAGLFQLVQSAALGKNRASSRALFFAALSLGTLGLWACHRSRVSPDGLLLAVNAGVEANGLNAAAREYRKQKGVPLQVIEYPYQSLFEKLLISLTSPSSNYDLVMIDDPWFPRFAEMGGLLELEPLFRQRGLPGPDEDFVETSMSLCRHPYGNGALYALPYVGNTQLFFYRRDLFEKHGLPAPRTWDEVYRHGKTIGRREQMHGYVMRAAQGNAIVTDFMPLFWAFGAEMFDGGGRPNVNSLESIEALEFMLKLAEIAPPGYVNFNADEVGAHLLQGTALTAINWPAWIPAFDDPSRSRVVDKIDFLPVPSQKRPGASAIGNWLLGIPRRSSKARQAFEFLLWVTSREQMRQSALLGNPPTRKSVFEDKELIGRFRAYPVQYQALLRSRPRPRSPVWNEMENTFGIYLSQANAGFYSPREALDAANREMEQILERWNSSMGKP